MRQPFDNGASLTPSDLARLNRSVQIAETTASAKMAEVPKLKFRKHKVFASIKNAGRVTNDTTAE